MRPFILLEFLIALTLFIFCAPLFVNEPLLLLNKESLCLEKMELQRIAENHYGELKARLSTQEIEWKTFGGGKKETPFVEQEEKIKVLSHNYKEKYKIWTVKEKTENSKIFRRVGIEILFTPPHRGKPQSFFYEVFVVSALKEKTV